MAEEGGCAGLLTMGSKNPAYMKPLNLLKCAKSRMNTEKYKIYLPRFSLNRPHWADSVIECHISLFVCLPVCLSAPTGAFFLGLSLALRSRDQFQASHWSPPPPPKINMFCFEFLSFLNLLSPPKFFLFFLDTLKKMCTAHKKSCWTSQKKKLYSQN